MLDWLKEQYERFGEYLTDGGSYGEGRLVGYILALIAIFIFLMFMLFVFG